MAIQGQSGSDTNLDLIMDRQLTNHWDNSSGPLDLTVSGLVAGESYQVDLLIGNDDDLYGGSWRYSFQEDTATIALRSVMPGVLPMPPSVITARNVAADAQGRILIGIELLDLFDGPYFSVNAIAVSQVPEPSLLLWLGAGLIGLSRTPERRCHGCQGFSRC